MSSKHSKKKVSKSPEKTKIKTEKLDNAIYTMDHYVGDPVELIKQVFSTLNQKTIKNLAPECIKECKIEEIQELCLNELLGISSKRLKSIINATKCPTDTESSDDDVQNIDEHISLEEISSDSDNEKRSDNKIGKEISVLELLELQARARAIRSQLALEPIAKIEVDSDDSNHQTEIIKSKSNINKNSSSKSTNNKSALKVTQVGEKRKDDNKVLVNGNGSNSDANRPKKIKLKRNFRKRSIDTENDLNSVNDNIGKQLSEQNSDVINKISELSEDIVNKNENERSLSPEVLPIMPNYETLCISDSDDDNGKGKQINNKILLTETVEIHENGKILDTDISTEKNEIKTTADFEDGEILDNNVKDIDTNDNISKKIKENKSDVPENNKSNNVILGKKKEIDLNDYDEQNDDIISLGDDDLDYEMHDPIEENLKITPKIERKSPEKNDELTESADFIELHDSGDENESTENQGQSWNSRWLKSKKVSKIMAESKLVNRVRDKRKQSKKEQQQQQQQQKQTESSKEKEKIKFKLKLDRKLFCEDGSIQQYKEIVNLENKIQ